MFITDYVAEKFIIYESMIIFDKRVSIEEEIRKLKKDGKSIGFVPTMGALHQGHLELVKRCKQENDITVTSIFVNPIQFNNKNDLEHYPRDLENDTRKLEETGCDFLFHPDVKEIYPENNVEKYDLDGLDTIMEGKFRPGHFQGVVAVVKRFFDIIAPHNVYFGEKDFQQLTIIKHVFRKLMPHISVISCPTIREKDGLAMSSRNLRLSEELRKKVPVIYQSLLECRQDTFKYTFNGIKEKIIGNINNISDLEVEYFEIVNMEDLRLLNNWTDKCTMVACIAVWAGNVRLIDNIKLN